jgi:phospholipid/cholesterol/gamma-HCH transport system substrate-binding protein
MNKEVKIGLISIVAIAVLIFGINYLKGVNMFRPSNSYYFEFTDINGLAESSPVFANGFNVGTVHGISYDYSKPGHVMVEVEVNEKMRLPQGTVCELVSDMLGNTKLNLLIPTDTANYCQPGDTLEGRVNAGLMGVAAETLVPQMAAMLPKLDSIMQSLNTLLADPAIANTLHHTEQITANLDVTTRQLNALMKNDLPALTGRLNHIADNFSGISDNLKQVDYAATMQKVDSTLYNVEQLTAKLNRTDNTVGLFFNDPSLYQNLSTTANNAATLLEDLKAHPKRYVHFSLFGKKDK